ncbi:hypothetical protein [Natronococcus jeotgali]|uniref:C2H2-type domain-containing protein n=1 Tax=Natronococcus jeotgali DSM 18795 TaxID=1227498 RepID=L9XGU0_9EURY|nr:hypothetical protein [Natronococcus jeotgali]ELY60832.1 hypothetical protein C492_10040 [Natronococcus jeotgali DSM 18795]
MNAERLKRVLEFFVIGIVFGVTEDVLAVLFATDADVTPGVVAVVVLIAIPFALLSEIVVDHPKFVHFDRLAFRLRGAVDPDASRRCPPRIHRAGRRDRLLSPSHHHHRCALCGTTLPTGPLLREHVERRHPSAAVHWWIVAAPADWEPRPTRAIRDDG